MFLPSYILTVLEIWERSIDAVIWGRTIDARLEKQTNIPSHDDTFRMLQLTIDPIADLSMHKSFYGLIEVFFWYNSTAMLAVMILFCFKIVGF